jgi:hypothetical protein
MIIFLRQSEISIGTKDDHELTLQQACFIKSRFIEIYENGVEFAPADWREHAFIKRVQGDCWLEPFNGITYDFFFVYPSERLDFLPKHLEIIPIEE